MKKKYLILLFIAVVAGLVLFGCSEAAVLPPTEEEVQEPVPPAVSEIAVYQGSTLIENGGSIDLGQMSSSTEDFPFLREFRIENSGTAELTLTGTTRVEISGTDTVYFSIPT